VAVEKVATIDTDALASAIAQGIATIAPRHEIKEGDPEYVARQHAEGWYDDFFGVTVLQNAYEAQARGLSEETRRRASQLRPGAYIKGRVKVTVEQNGTLVRLSYPVKGDNLQNNRDHWSSFTDLIDKIWAEMGPTAA
jgi:hypothetical protein